MVVVALPPTSGSPSRLGPYTLVKRLAAGGMAELFLARRDGPQGFTKTFVIKKLLPHLASDQQFVRMFLNEARLAALMSHPNVVSVFDLGEEADLGNYYLAMEFLDGCNLVRLQRLYREKHAATLPQAISAKIVIDACAGLEFAHNLTHPDGRRLNVVHRDVSPENIFVTVEGMVKVLDFGVAKAEAVEGLTTAGHVKGKFGFMSPELLLGERVDRRADIWALGITLYWLISGIRPFRGGSEGEIVQRILNDSPPPLHATAAEVPEELRKIIFRALEKKAVDRYSSAAEMQHALEQWMVSNRATVHRVQIAELLQEILPPRAVRETYPVEPLSGSLSPPRAGASESVVAGSVAPLAEASEEDFEIVEAATEAHSVATLQSTVPSRWRRMGAYGIEALVPLVFLPFLFLTLPWLPFAAFTLASGLSILVFGATPGHALMQLRVAAASGQQTGFLTRMLRFVFTHGWSLAFVLLFQRLVRGLVTPEGLDLVALGWAGAAGVSAAGIFSKSRQTFFDRLATQNVTSSRS